MASDVFLRAAGLDALAEKLTNCRLGYAITVGPVSRIVGRAGEAGAKRPLPSSACELDVNGYRVWIPAPCKPGDPQRGDAPVYEFSGVEYVMPTIRLFAAEATQPTYLSLSEWILDAFTEWKFKFKETTASALDRLLPWRGRESAARAARVIAFFVRLALIGQRTVDLYRGAARKELGLGLPVRRHARIPDFRSRIAKTNDVAWAAARRQVLTLVGRPESRLPRRSRSADHRIRPNQSHDRGIDPVHTPETKDTMRLVGHLGNGVGIENRRLSLLPGADVALSPSTARIPFARFDAPRRLLMGAKAQTQAIEVVGDRREPPLVNNGLTSPDPPGVELRVAYCAWKGLNHEDAWVISESAAAKLCAPARRHQNVFIAALDGTPELLVGCGERVSAGQLLLRRSVSPALLAPLMKGIVDVNPSAIELIRLSLEGDSPRAEVAGIVESVEIWNLATGEGVPEDVRIMPDARTRHRLVVRFVIRQDLRLEVADKLANRHGHKGIVGRILPDDQMPRWNGQPLEALIDPISVLNRSNWGQIYETLLGAALTLGGMNRHSLGSAVGRSNLLAELKKYGHDSAGRAWIEPPERGDDWMLKHCRAVAGVQWVMRLPKHAASEISADLSGHKFAPSVRRAKCRLGEQGTWACWAHGISKRAHLPKLSKGAERFLAALRGAGIDMCVDSEMHVLRIRRLELSMSDEVPGVPVMNLEGDRTEVLDRVRRGPCDNAAFLDLGERIDEIPAPGSGTDLKLNVALVPVPPIEIRPSNIDSDGHEHLDQLTRGLASVAGIAFDRRNRRQGRRAPSQCSLRRAVAKALRAAYYQAVGTISAGHKDASIGQMVLSRSWPRSGRAVASPAGWAEGRMELGLDEVGLPPTLARALIGKRIRDDCELLETFGSKRPIVWVKRDPVLHRWGLLGLKVRVVEGNSIRLPASVLAALGADFDGDTVAVFGSLPGNRLPDPPSQMAEDEVLGRAIFLPSKQYIYGLHLLGRDECRLKALKLELRRLGAPSWPKSATAKQALERWAVRAGHKKTDACMEWWEAIERHALTALAMDPGMQLGLLATAQLPHLDVVTCGAAKGEIFEGFQPGSELFDAFRGQSLAVYESSAGQSESRPPDLIETVMAPAGVAVGKFGNVPRRLIFAAKKLTKGFMRDAHALSEQANQRVLGVKAGYGGLKFEAFRKHILRPLLAGKALDIDAMPRSVKEFLTARPGLSKACERLRRKVYKEGDVPGWLQWLKEPTELGKILDENGGQIELPLDDARVRPFLRVD